MLVALVATVPLAMLFPADALASREGHAAPLDLGGDAWTARVADGEVVSVDAGRSTRAALADIAARGRDVTPSELLDATARLWTEAGTPAVTLDASAGKALAAFPMPDATGDGLADAVTLDLDAEGLHVTVRRGIDGAVAWSRALDAVGSLVVGPTQDVTGDGLGDLLLLTLDVGHGRASEQCAEEAATCFLAFGGSAVWRLAMLSGADGARVWTGEDLAVAGGASQLTFSWDPSLLANTGLGAALKVAIVPTFLDARDDGARGIVLHEHSILYANTHSARWDEPGAHAVSAGSYHLATQASLVDGATGARTPLRAFAGAFGEAALVPAGDAVGDARDDLLWWSTHLRSVPASACVGVVCAPRPVEDQRIITLEMIDGATLTRTWSLERPIEEGMDAAFVAALLADATGDGRADLYVREEVSFSLEPPRLALVSGADGAEVWAAPAYWAFALGSIDGGAGSDLALTFHAIAEEGVRATIARVDGATGALLHASERLVPWPEGFGYVLVSVKALGLVDGDDVVDVIFGTVSSSFIDTSSWWTVESGATGDTLHEHVAPRHAALLLAGDLDADSVADVYAVEYDGDVWQGVFTLRGISLAYGVALWERVDHVDGFAPRVSIVPSEPLVAGPGDDLLYRIASGWGEDLAASVKGMDGGSGAQLWTVG